MFHTDSLWAIILSLLAAITGFLFYSHGSAFTRYLEDHSCNSQSPYYPSWNTWFHPSSPWNLQNKHKPSIQKDWDLLYHLGGYGPWIEKIDGHPEIQGLEPPEGCSIDQIHMLSRHAERYPTTNAGARHIALLDRIQKANVMINGSLSFLNNWTYFTDQPSKDFNQLTRTGPYAGTLEAFMTGVRFLTRYMHLQQPDQEISIWASDSERVIDTAKYFASGFFGQNWERHGKAFVEVIPETFERGADTLTPGDTCLWYIQDAKNGHGNGYTMLGRFQDVYIPDIARRLIVEGQNQGIGPFTNSEIWSMQELCGFEILVRGSSPWCSVFTKRDWEHFAYARDLLHYYRAGPGNPYAGAMGWLWLNATTSLLRAGPESGNMFFSFVHDGDIAPFLTALQILQDPKYDPHLPTTHIAEDRIWRTSSVMSMGGRIVFERMVCPSAPNDNTREERIYLRTVINDKPVPLPYCQHGPGFSCPMDDFVEFVQRRRQEVGDFADVCGLEGDVGHITFLKQIIPYQSILT